MSEKIQTKIFEHGHQNESSWPPLFGDGKPGVYYIDKVTGQCKEGYPPPEIQINGQAPMFISDSITPYYHPGACKWTDSRAKINRCDKDHGTITTDKQIKADPEHFTRLAKARQKDLHKCMRQAVTDIDNGIVNLPEEVRAKCDRTNEVVSQALNIDAFNMVGRKRNEKGNKFKRFRRR